MPLTFQQITPTSTSSTATTSANVTSGSILIATTLTIGPATNPLTGVADVTNGTWNDLNAHQPASYNSGGNYMSTFWVRNTASGATLTATLGFPGGSPTTIRFWFEEYTGQAATNPIVSAGGIVFALPGSPSVGSSSNTTPNSPPNAIPAIGNYTDLTAIVSAWSPSGAVAWTNFDSGAGTIRAAGGSGISFLADHALANSGNVAYTPTCNQTGSSGNTMNGGILLVRSTTSVLVGGGLLLGVG